MKNSININSRLIKTISFADKCSCIADVGSDHGYSSIYMVQEGIAQSVIATDISKPSLAKTQRLVEECGLGSKIQCRVGDGLKIIAPGEVDAVLIAGMGAELIADILEQSFDVARQLKFAVLQPMNSAEALRRRLAQMNYCITAEGIVADNGKFYQILKVQNGQSNLYSPEEFEIGAFVYKEKIPLCKEFVEHLVLKYEKILSYIGDNDTDRISDVNSRLCRCRKVLQWILAE